MKEGKIKRKSEISENEAHGGLKEGDAGEDGGEERRERERAGREEGG